MHETMLRAFEASGGLSSADLARAINESPTNRGKRGISKAGAIKVANVFGVSVDWLLTGVTADKRVFFRLLFQSVVKFMPKF